MTRVAALVLLAACHGSGAAANDPAHPRPTTGGIAGIAFDHDTGYAIEGAKVSIVAIPTATARSGTGGLFELEQLPPGRYTLHGTLAGQSVDEPNVDIVAGDTTFAKLAFTPAHPDQAVVQDSGALTAITRYAPDDLQPGSGRIEGFVIQPSSHAAVAGAVVMAVRADDPTHNALQTASDDHGAYRLDGVEPGTYVISAYYSIGQRGQIEVRRSDVAVAQGDAVVVPLVVELDR